VSHLDENSGTIRNRLIATLSEAEQVRLAPFFEEVDLRPKTQLCTSGQPISHAVFLHDAITSTLMDLPEGESIEVGLMGAEGFVGIDLMFGARESISTVVVQIPGRGARIKTDDLQRELLAKNPAFHALLVRYTRAFFGMVAQAGACNASHGIQQRLARWLLMVHDRLHRDRFPLTHEFIALMLGVRRASVTEAANQLRTAGAIDYDRGEVCILNRATLEQSACGCYLIVRQLGESIFTDSTSGVVPMP
jgi:CRP-like cAMP-binding protein